MKTNKPKVIEYINQLNNYDTDEIALALMKPEYKMYEEAFQIYKKQKGQGAEPDTQKSRAGQLSVKFE